VGRKGAFLCRRQTSTRRARECGSHQPDPTAFTDDAAGNRVSVTDALGRKTVLAYDDLY
jgi:YD repeat-containing protein